MSQLHGKQLKNTSTSLDKLNGSGIVSFDAATMSFNTGAVLRTADNNIVIGTDVVNKNYVDSVATGLEIKESARVISTTSITLSGTQSIDGIDLTAGDRVLVAGQGGSITTGTTSNGIYVVSTGAWTRAEDMDEPIEVNGGEFVFVKEGSTYADTGWVVALPDSTMNNIGDALIKFTQFSAAGVITAGLGLLQTGNTFDIITGVGLTASANELKLADTTTATGEFGSATEVPVFTVDQQGRLTASSEVLISIPSGQVNNFTSSVDTLIFDSNNFLDSSTVDFDVTAGSTVSAYVKVNKATGLTISSSGVEINYGLGLTISGDQLVVDSSTFGVQGADNGLSIDGSSNVILGGTLSQDTSIEGTGTYGLTFNDLSEFNINGGTINIGAGDNLDISAGATISVTASNIKFASDNTTYTDTNTGSKTGIKYAAAGYVTDDRSLTDKQYVDDLVASATLSTTYFATDGITLTGNTFSLSETTAGNGLTYSSGVLSINVNSDSLEIVSDVVRLKDTITGQRTFSNGIVVNQGATVSGQLVANDGVSITSSGLTVSNNTHIGGNLNVLGDFTVAGTFSYINTTELLVEDNYITLNSGLTNSAPINGGLELLRGTYSAASILWNETSGYWQIGLSGSESTVITEAGTGLSKTNNTLSIDTTGFTTDLAGNGLTANGGALDVNVDISGLTISNDVVALQSTITGNRTFSDYLTADGGLDVNSGLTVSGNTILENTLSVSGTSSFTGQLDANGGVDVAGGATVSGGLSVSGGSTTDTLTVTGTSSFTGLLTADGGVTASTGFFTTSLQTPNAPTTANDVINLTYFEGNAIQQVLAGFGLSGGGSTGSVTLDVNTGLGLTISTDDVAMVWGGTATGLTFSNNAISANVDGTTIIVNGSGQLSVIAGSAQPVYDLYIPSATYSGTNGAGDATSFTISQTPNDYSRIEVYVNGQRQLLGATTSNFDCWFGEGDSAISLSAITSGDKLVWNAQSAGFSLQEGDRVEVVYES